MAVPRRRNTSSQVKVALLVCTVTFFAMGIFAYICFRGLELWFSTTMSFQNTQVYLLSDDNFDKFLDNAERDVLITFYAPWCPYCRGLKPELIKFAEQERSRVFCAAVDVTQSESLASRYHIESLPTIMWFHRDDKEHPVIFEKKRRDITGLVAFMKENM
ncbi:Protein disulfide-isomerase A6 [Galdieria sulphuraria]|uniref:Protein disulfide isomerase n=1 Tax=Galdieria sulphuraria TaxID=130081 RepID=M2VTU4_GALSU|nr:protein disulfide isomerase [Galdieria sulphuraria]EME26621.1 protein disulfide isomerase [Galdieria sulphuraria]GJD08719.1 Protein disulfide-isomerase A6 [Galdieria sulphuraria]|eukprot:XP_005703141.1 protein disulfide isomerase [Galdieria sulphuraria]